MYVCVCSKRFFSKQKTACFLFKILVLNYLELFMCTLGTDKRIYLFLWIKSTKKMVWHDLIFVESEKTLYKLIWMKCYLSIFKIIHERKMTYIFIYKHKNKSKQCSQLSQRAYGFWVVHSLATEMVQASTHQAHISWHSINISTLKSDHLKS